jgi:GNAT superfamily N-acetyltransferase
MTSLHPCSSAAEWAFAKKMRQTYFFDPLALNDPYIWTFQHSEHAHLILSQDNIMVGYAHIQFWPEHRAALRILVVDQPHRHQGLGGQFLHLLEQWLKHQGIRTLHDEARPSALPFYRKHGYIDMPFNDPSGEPPSPHDVAVGKAL